MALGKGSFGMVALLVTTAIVLLLVAQRWRLLTSSSRQAAALAQPGGAAPDPAPADGLPGLGEAEVLTDAHADAVTSALETTQD